MVAIHNVNVIDAFNKVCALTDYNFHDNITKRHKFRKQAIRSDKYLTKDEKSEVIQLLNKDYDYNKILYDDYRKMRRYEDGNHECLATLYCKR